MDEYLIHQKRLENDYKSMQRITSNVITWSGFPAANPELGIYPSTYRVTYHLRAYTTQGLANEHIIAIDISSLDYPRQIPKVEFVSPVLKHPHLFDDGRVCLGGFPLEESLAELCIRLARFIQYDPNVINLGHQASLAFRTWYLANLHFLPIDFTPLPEINDFSPGFQPKEIRRPGMNHSDEPGGMTIRRRSPGNSSF